MTSRMNRGAGNGARAPRPELQAGIEPFLHAVAEAEKAALLLDYDGTLAPFHEKRDQAFLYPGVARLLQEIVHDGHTQVVVISGRDVQDLLPLLAIHPRPEVWGIHGLQRLRADGTLETSRLDERVIDALADAERWLVHEDLRHTAEIKWGSIAVHWRGLDEGVAEELRRRVLAGWGPIAARTQLKLLMFDGGVEIHTAKANKGDAVRAFLKEIGPEIPVAYLGDDNTDETAFLAIGNRGISALVRPQWRKTAAVFWLKPPDEVIGFLEMWLRSCRGDHSWEDAAEAVNE